MPKTEMQRMADAWDARARDDARYFVAFEQENQGDAFWKGGTDVAALVESNYHRFRLPRGVTDKRVRALDIGCGPGRLMAHLAPVFDEIHGVDVSPEMIQQARSFHSNPRLHFHALSGEPAFDFPDGFFDCVYSFAVFQHIPYRSVIDAYFSEAFRVLKAGGVLAVQVRMSPHPVAALEMESWAGVVLTREDVIKMANELGFRLGSVDGESEQYIWIIARKPASAGISKQRPALLSVTSCEEGAAGLTSWGVGAVGSLFLSGVPEATCDLNRAAITIGGRAAQPLYFGPSSDKGVVQINFLVPPAVEVGTSRLQLDLDDEGTPWQASCDVTILPPPEERLEWLWLSDGAEVMRRRHVRTGVAKVQLRGVRAIEDVSLEIEGETLIRASEFISISERLGWHEMNFRIDESLLGQRRVRLSHPTLGATGWQTVLFGEAQQFEEHKSMS